jgi:hypothetical protein
MKEKEF